jgi:predicted nucleic acid-binding protein
MVHRKPGLSVSVYADTSFILALYHSDALNSRAAAYMARHAEPLVLTAVQDTEVRNASRLRVAQRRSSSEEVFRALAYFDRDITNGIYARQSPDWSEVFRLLERTSQRYTERGAYRFADLLHIACALTLQAKVFLSFDQRQSGLAKTLGLKAPF